jgi:hypothetical protein
MTLLPLLIVVTVAGGGPALAPGEKPPVLRNTTITVRHDTRSGWQVLGKSQDGQLRLRLRPGTYEITAQLHDQSPETSHPNCETETVHIRRGQRTRRISLSCQVK